MSIIYLGRLAFLSSESIVIGDKTLEEVYLWMKFLSKRIWFMMLVRSLALKGNVICLSTTFGWNLEIKRSTQDLQEEENWIKRAKCFLGTGVDGPPNGQLLMYSPLTQMIQVHILLTLKAFLIYWTRYEATALPNVPQLLYGKLLFDYLDAKWSSDCCSHAAHVASTATWTHGLTNLGVEATTEPIL